MFKCLTYPDCKCCRKYNILVVHCEGFRISSDLFQTRAKRLEMQILHWFICTRPSATRSNRYSLRDLFLYAGLKFVILNFEALFSLFTFLLVPMFEDWLTFLKCFCTWLGKASWTWRVFSNDHWIAPVLASSCLSHCFCRRIIWSSQAVCTKMLQNILKICWICLWMKNWWVRSNTLQNLVLPLPALLNITA